MQAVRSKVVCDTCARVTKHKYYGKKDAKSKAGCQFAGNSRYAAVQCPFHGKHTDAKALYGSFWLHDARHASSQTSQKQQDHFAHTTPQCGKKGDPPLCSTCKCSPVCQCPRAPEEQWRSSRIQMTVQPTTLVDHGNKTDSDDNPWSDLA